MSVLPTVLCVDRTSSETRCARARARARVSTGTGTGMGMGTDTGSDASARAPITRDGRDATRSGLRMSSEPRFEFEPSVRPAAPLGISCTPSSASDTVFALLSRAIARLAGWTIGSSAECGMLVARRRTQSRAQMHGTGTHARTHSLDWCKCTCMRVRFGMPRVQEGSRARAQCTCACLECAAERAAPGAWCMTSDEWTMGARRESRARMLASLVTVM
jgi:hypothetical protein